MEILGFWMFLAVAVCGLQAASPCSILDKEVQSWIIKDFERIRSNKIILKFLLTVLVKLLMKIKKLKQWLTIFSCWRVILL